MAVSRACVRDAAAHHIATRLRKLDTPNLINRNRAIRELLRQDPPIIVASMIDSSPNEAERIVTEYGTV